MNIKSIIKKTLSIAVISALGLTGIVPSVSLKAPDTAKAAWDGYVTEGQSMASSFDVVNFNSIGSILSAGAKPSKNHTTDGNVYSARWNNHTKNTDFWVKSFDDSVPTDWSLYKEIVIKIYSEKATGAKLYTVLYNPDAADGIRYFSTTITVDWAGWKEIRINLSSLGGTRSPTWNQMTGFRFVAHGNWNMVGNPETDLYIASIKVSGYTDGMDFVNDFYKSEVLEQAYASLKDSAAVYAGGVNVVNEKGRNAAEYSFGYVDDVVTVPAKIFADYLGAEVTDNGSAYSITLNDITVSGTVDSDSTSEGAKLSIPAYASDSMCYVPGEDVAKLLGLGAFTDGKLLVMGTDTAVNTLRRPGNLGVNEMNEIVGYSAFSDKWDKDAFKPEDCDPVKDNWRKYLVGSEEINDMNDEHIASKIKSISTAGKASWNNLIKGDDVNIFKGVVFEDSADMTTAYSHVKKMALAYAAYGSELYQNEALLSDIIYALDWLYERYFSTQGRSRWKVPGFDNWHDWDIGTPEAIIHTLLCIEDKISFEEKEKYLSYFNVDNPKPKSTAANYCHLSELIIGSAMLLNDHEKALKIVSQLQKEYLYVDDNQRTVESQLVARDFPVETKGAGFFTDGSYIFHTLHAMNGTYGPKHYNALVQIESLLAGTKFSIPFSFKDNLVDFYFNTFDPVTYEVGTFRSVLGRGTNPSNATNATGRIVTAFLLAETLPEGEDKLALYGAVKESYAPATDQIKNGFINSLPVDMVKRFKEVMADDSIPAREPRRLSKVFYNMDKSVHIRPEWAGGVSMSSSRIFNYECINEENLDGWYLGDGRTEYFLSGSTMNGTMQYWSSMDKYRLPGTTVDTQPRQAISVDQGNEYLSTKDFVGGVMLGKNAEYSASAMDLESYHNDVDFGKDTAHGHKNPAHKSDLVAKKSYFMLDDGFICLGSAVNAKNNNNAEVLTIVDNMLSNKTKTYSDETTTPYTIVSAVASRTPEAENVAMNTIDNNFGTKWAGEQPDEIVWDLGEVRTLGFANISLLQGSKRKQHLTLQISSDKQNWETVFDGDSSGMKEMEEPFDLKGKEGRYVKYINKGNSAGSVWVSITECKIYPPNADGSIGTKEADTYGDDPITVDGNVIELMGDDKVLTGSKWVNFNNQVGYYFPENASVNSGELKCRWTKSGQSHFELWFSHGVNPTDGGYAYVVLPGMTSEETAAFASGGNITFLANDKNLQAATDNRTGITYITFWQPGSIAGITASVPCMVIARRTDDGMEIGISDPTRKLKEGTVTINSALTAVEADEFAEVSNDGTNTTIKLNFDKSTGRTYSFKLSK